LPVAFLLCRLQFPTCSVEQSKCHAGDAWKSKEMRGLDRRRGGEREVRFQKEAHFYEIGEGRARLLM
jgi:hypothetical protein